MLYDNQTYGRFLDEIAAAYLSGHRAHKSRVGREQWGAVVQGGAEDGARVVRDTPAQCDEALKVRSVMVSVLLTLVLVLLSLVSVLLSLVSVIELPYNYLHEGAL